MSIELAPNGLPQSSQFSFISTHPLLLPTIEVNGLRLTHPN